MNSQKLFEHAKKDEGLKETAGPASTSRIKTAIEEAAKWLDKDDSKTSWCGCIMGLWCRELNLPTPKEYFRAINWLNVGTAVKLKDARPGDIVVMSRPGGNHVTLFVEAGATNLKCLGGNQSNSVNVSSFRLDTVKGLRRL